MNKIALLLLFLFSRTFLFAQQETSLPVITDVEAQPLLAQSLRLGEALEFLGSSLSESDAGKLKALQQKTPGPEIVKEIQQILDPYCIAMVNINPEARVKLQRGPATPRLIQNGWTSFLVKVHNEAGVTAKLEPHSSNTGPLFFGSTNDARPPADHHLTPGQVANRFTEMAMYRNRPMQPNLSGLLLEYSILQIYSRDEGKREIELGFHVGQGTQDIGFRNAINILFTIRKAVKVKLRVSDDNGKPAMASFIFKDNIERIVEDSIEDIKSVDYRITRAQLEYWQFNKSLRGIYPLPSRRLAMTDEYPDFFFQPQVYRADGEHIYLPPGNYTVQYTRGPEYLDETKTIVVPEGKDSMELSFQLKRWINLSDLSWYSGDHHVHAAGCSHYDSPAEGVTPEDMWRQQIGEDLNIAAVLTWGPGWYHQKGYFTGQTSALSTTNHIMRYDVEVSGFPSSHAGHLVLLRLKEDDYPGTKTIEDWPSWTQPVLKWAKSQGAATAYAHSGWGLEPLTKTNELPNYIVPKMDGIGANEYVVTVTDSLIDFYSAGNTPYNWEMNMWYHSLNCGFRTRISGETDFPCIYDERVGLVRSYIKSESTLDFNKYVEAIKTGRSYVTDGNSHIINFAVNNIETGTQNSELKIQKPQSITITAKTAAWLSEQQDEEGKNIRDKDIDDQPYWHIERARIGSSRKIAVELIVNGFPVDTAYIVADGKWNDVNFNYTPKASCWIALRVKYSSHTNPFFVVMNNKTVAIKQSAEWCEKAVDQCWKMKQGLIRQEERTAARLAYDKAKAVYRKIITGIALNK